mgnify:CR=1 FL=1
MEPSHLILICFVCFGGSLLTFFSGFGLGTLLLPVFSLFFDLPVAIGMTALVHLLNNLFKLHLTWQYASREMVFLFGIPSALAAFAGAWLLGVLATDSTLVQFEWVNVSFQTNWMKIIIGSLLVLFAWLEWAEWKTAFSNGKFWLPVGGLLSGFFGGLSGHQGELRTLFLVGTKMSKEAMIGTGVVIACMVDLVRIGFYATGPAWTHIDYPVVGLACLAAFAGAWSGRYFLQKLTLPLFRKIIAALLMVFGLMMVLGWV